jgi:hypothetical protein
MIKSISVLLGTLAVLLSVNLKAEVENFKFDEEAYINDIPFDTEGVTAGYRCEQAMTADFNFEDEAYIDDIPFNTECVSANCHYQQAIGKVFDFEDESYIDDIPFNTHTLASGN